MRQLYAHDYRAAGLATLARQVTLGAIAISPYSTEPVTLAAQVVLKSVAHRANMAIKTLENVAAMSTILVEQAAYPLLLQTSHEIDKLMATQIPLEKGQVNIFKTIHPFFLTTSPLAYLSLGNYIFAFEAQIDAHQTVLDHFNTLWEHKITTVTGIIDGDTIYVRDFDLPVRLEGVNCPEIYHEGISEGDPDDPKWDAGDVAKAFTESKLLNKVVELRARKKLDDYGRIVAKVHLEGKDFANEIVFSGNGEFIFWTFL